MSEVTARAFDELYHQYKAMVFQLCTGFMKGDRELADDLVQEIFINIWNALPSYREEASHKTWIYRIAVNTCLQYIRKQKNRQNIPIESILVTPHTSEEINKGDQFKILHNAIAQLDDVDRLIIMMVLEELEYDEISKVVGISEGNLRVKIHRIKQRLKKIMDHE